MRTIYKYNLASVVEDITTHEGAKFIHVDNQYEKITVWAEVDTRELECNKRLHVVGTGQRVPEEADQHIGSAVFSGGDYVFHVYTDVRDQ